MSEETAEYSVNLTASEIVRLDGVCSEDVQKVVLRAKDALSLKSSGLTDKQAAMVAKIVSVAREKGRLTYSGKPITSCPCCGRYDGYYPYQRSGKYHRKGQPNYKAPKTFVGYGLDEGFVTVQHHISVGYCVSCKPVVEPVLLPLLDSVTADFPDHWKAAPHRYRRFDNKICTSCGWEGHEGEMRPMMTLMGNGTYPGGCPKCDAANRPLGVTMIKARDGFTIVERPMTNEAAPAAHAAPVPQLFREASNPPPPNHEGGR